jgi:phosphoribosyl-AMP cyclohydrolase
MLKFDEKGLIPVIVQDAKTGEILMLGYANNESLKLTVESGEVWFYSRSRQELWHKGATSGSILKVKSMAKDCDSDAILIKAEPAGPVCHTGNWSCFFQEFNEEDIASS